LAKVNPPIRSREDVKFLWQTLLDGKIDWVCSDHACCRPARRFGLLRKGNIAQGFDADLVLVDPQQSFVVRAAESESRQGYTPFEGMELTGKVMTTILRGNTVYDGGSILGIASGPISASALLRAGTCCLAIGPQL
jgi:allantoinase